MSNKIDGVLSKKYYWELSKFDNCDSLVFKDMKKPLTAQLYVYKQDNPQIMVKLLNPLEKIQGWTFTELQILEQQNDNPRLAHWKSQTITFKGQLILTLFQNFKQKINQQIELSIPRINPKLQNWMRADIVDVFSIKKKSSQSFGNEHAFMEIRTLYRNRYVNYYQMRRWSSKKWEGLLQIADEENILINNSYGLLMDEIYMFVMSFEVIREEKYQNMFDIYMAKKTKPKPEQYKDQYQKNYERRVMEKYRLYEYIEDI